YSTPETTPRQSDRNLRQRPVRRKEKAIARDARLVPERATKRLAEGQRRVLGGVVLVDLEIALGSQLEREPAVPGESFEHVIEKADPGRDLDGLEIGRAHV